MSAARWSLLVVLALAAALRLAFLDTIPGFNGDEGQHAFYARQLAEGGPWRLRPVRAWIGPWHVWGSAPFFMAFDASPAVARLLTALSGVAAVGCAAFVGTRWRSPRFGVLLAALIAVAPWAVTFSRAAWGVSLLPATTLASIVALLLLVERPSVGRAGALGLGLGLTASVHAAGIPLAPAILLGVLLWPEARALLRRPGLLGAVALGYVATAWTLWPVFGDLLGFGSGIDYSRGTLTDTTARPVVYRLLSMPAVVLDSAAGGRLFDWFAGGRGPGWLLGVQVSVAAAFLVGAVRVVREGDGPGRALLGACVAVFLMTGLKSSEFDVAVSGRDRYLLVLLPLVVLVAARAFSGLRSRWTLAVPWLLVGAQALALQVGYFEPLKSGGAADEPGFLVAEPDAKLQEARRMLVALGTEEEGLLLCGDFWTYWALLPFLGERMPIDYLPEDPAAGVAILKRTRHRRRFLVDFAGWHWNETIAATLAESGYGDVSPRVTSTPDGRPILLVWELPPDGPPP